MNWISTDALVTLLNDQPLLALVLAVGLGKLLGGARIYGFALGTSGVLFAAMALGHFGVHLPPVLGDFGIVLFVYAVGLQAGPHFLRTIRRHGWLSLVLAIATLGAAWVTMLALARLLGVSPALATGIYAGALTSTPALAASLQVVNDPAIPVGYGVAYPIGVVGVLLFVELVPRLLRIDWREEKVHAEQGRARPAIEFVWIEITNPQIDGKTIQDVEATHMSRAVISRLYDKHVATRPQATTQLRVGQHVRVVGTAADIRRMELLLGPRIADFHEPQSTVTSATLVVTEDSFTGQTLQETQFRERYGVTVTRIWRDDFEFVPGGHSMFEIGDEIRIVGDAADCQRVAQLAGDRPERLNETNFLPLGLGLLAGVLLGQLPIPLPGGLSIQLGLAGGPLLAGMVAGHYGRIGPISFRMPVAARLFVYELGLILFLASAGIRAGESFWPLVETQGATLLTAAVVVKLVPLLVAYGLAKYAFRWDALTSFGAMCGAMTCTPGLGAVTKLTGSSAPSVAYVAVYPMALLTVSLLAPLLGAALRAW
jgi:putative transport protein